METTGKNNLLLSAGNRPPFIAAHRLVRRLDRQRAKRGGGSLGEGGCARKSWKLYYHVVSLQNLP